MTYTFLAPARQELEEAVAFYNGVRPGLGSEFAHEVERAAHRVVQNPLAWPKLTSSIRRCRLRRFPYALIFQARSEHILIVAVMHLRRRPDYWRDRMA